MEHSRTSRKLQNDTSKRKMISVVSEKHEFQNQDNSISQTNLEFVVHQNSDAKKELTVF